MKKIVTLCLTALLLVSTVLGAVCVSSAAVNASDVTVGSEFSRNKLEDVEAQRRFRQNIVSEDGLWSYLYYYPAAERYGTMKYADTTLCYSWNGEEALSGNGALVFCIVRDNGGQFHPGVKSDACKAFTAPASGTVTLETVIARVNEVNPEVETLDGTSFAIYKRTSSTERVKIFPVNADYEVLTSTAEKTYTVDVDVIKGEQIVFEIGPLENNSGDVVNMSNIVTYKSVSKDDTSVEITDTPKTSGSSSSDLIDLIPSGTSGNGKPSTSPKKDSGNSGLVIGIVIAAVVVVGIVIVVVVVKKKNAATVYEESSADSEAESEENTENDAE